MADSDKKEQQDGTEDQERSAEEIEEDISTDGEEEETERRRKPETDSGFSIQMTRTTAFGVLGAVMFVAWVVISSLPRYHQKHTGSWRPEELQPLPSHLSSPGTLQLQVTEDEVAFTTSDTQEVSVFYREVRPLDGATLAPPVLLLHGAGDSSQDWLDLGTMHVSAGMGHRTIALDLPGWGKTKTKSVEDPAGFLDGVMKALDVERPIIVTASASGSYVIPFLMTPNPKTCTERASGLITISPTGTEEYKPAQYHQCQIPAMLAYGEKDTKLGLESVGNLRNMANAEVFPVEEAGHAMMFEQPIQWHTLLYNFITATIL